MPRKPRPPRPYRVVITRYVDADGRRCSKGTPGAICQTTESESYYADLPGAKRTPLGTSDEAQAWKELHARLDELAAGDAAEYRRHAQTQLSRHLEEWCGILKAKGTSPQQIQLVRGRLTRLAELAGWMRLPDVTADSALLALARVQAGPNPDRPEESGLGKSAATRNYYLTHLKSFVSWAVDGGRLRGNPVRGLRPVNAEVDRRHLRRVPSAEEVAQLCRWLESGQAPVLRRMTGRERRLGYQLSMATGYRAGELRSLSLESFDLEEARVSVAAGYSKRRRRDTQQLPAWLVDELRDWFETGHGWGWSRLEKQGPGKVLAADLRRCRKAWIAESKDARERKRREGSDFLRRVVQTPDGPRFWDYHSFRHSYCDFMANLPGMDLRTLLSLTRHSTPELALKTYARSQQQRIRDAVDQLPPPLPPSPEGK